MHMVQHLSIMDAASCRIHALVNGCCLCNMHDMHIVYIQSLFINTVYENVYTYETVHITVTLFTVYRNNYCDVEFGKGLKDGDKKCG